MSCNKSGSETMKCNGETLNECLQDLDNLYMKHDVRAFSFGCLWMAGVTLGLHTNMTTDEMIDQSVVLLARAFKEGRDEHGPVN